MTQVGVVAKNILAAARGRTMKAKVAPDVAPGVLVPVGPKLGHGALRTPLGTMKMGNGMTSKFKGAALMLPDTHKALHPKPKKADVNSHQQAQEALKRLLAGSESASAAAATKQASGPQVASV